MRWLSCVLVVPFAVACGGDEVAPIVLPDGGNDANNINPDANGGNDTSTGNDGAAVDGAGNDGAVTDSSVADAAVFDPSAINGLVLWLDAAKKVTSKTVNSQTRVTLWADQTSHQNDANGFTQPQQFPLNPTAVSSGINALPVIHFDKGGGNAFGNILTILDNADTSLQWGTGDFYVVAVARFDNDPNDGNARGVANFFSKTFPNGQNVLTGVALFGNIPGANNTPAVGMFFSTENTTTNFVASTTARNNNTAHQFALQRVGTKLDMRIDGVSITTSTSAGINVDAKNAQVRIGSDFFGNFQALRMNGDIAEMMAVKGAFVGNDQAGLEGYLKTKYAL